MIEGRATAEKLKSRLKKLRPEFTPVKGPGGLPLSDMGWGTQSGEVKNIVDSKYDRMRPLVLEAGINVIDSSPAYRCQRSQSAVGQSIARAIHRGSVEREELFLITHAGWLAFDRKEEEPASFLEQSVLPGSSLEAQDFIGNAWSLHPDWITQQLDLACKLSGMASQDLLLLDAPEVGLKVWRRDEWEGRLRLAFERCEALVKEGRIQYYGICSIDGFRPAEDKTMAIDPLAIDRLAGEAAGGEHHFKTLQAPFNLAMLESLNAKNGKGQGYFDLLKDLGWWSVGCLPLGQGQLCHSLPEVLRTLLPEMSDPQRSLQFARSAAGIDTVLVGMKTREHVEENLSLLKHPPMKKRAWLSLFDQG